MNGPIDLDEFDRRLDDADRHGPWSAADVFDERGWDTGGVHHTRESAPSKIIVPKPIIIRPINLQGLVIPPRQWLVRSWAPWGVVTGLYGEGGLGKTLLAQQLQTAGALGRSWIGLDTTPVRSLAMYCEDSADELWRRQAEIDTYYGCDFRDLDDAVWMPRLGEENLLIRFGSKGVGELTPLHKLLIEAAKDHKAQLVIVDTVADTFGGNENDRGQVRQYVSWCLGTIAKEIGGSVVCCAHPSRAGITSGDGDGGSTGWSAAFRSRLSLHMPQADDGAPVDPDARVLTRKKANYAARNDAVSLHWKDGALVPDAVFGEVPRLRRSCVDVFMLLLDKLNTENRPVSDTRNASNYAPRMFGRRPERDSYRERDFVRAMEELFAAEVITMEEYGRRSDLRRKIVRRSDAFK